MEELTSKGVGDAYLAQIKSKWRSWSIWWGNLLIAIGGIDLILYALDNVSMLQQYLGPYGNAVLFVCGVINQALRFKSTQAVK